MSVSCVLGSSSSCYWLVLHQVITLVWGQTYRTQKKRPKVAMQWSNGGYCCCCWWWFFVFFMSRSPRAMTPRRAIVSVVSLKKKASFLGAADADGSLSVSLHEQTQHNPAWDLFEFGSFGRSLLGVRIVSFRSRAGIPSRSGLDESRCDTEIQSRFFPVTDDLNPTGRSVVVSTYMNLSATYRMNE